MRLSVIITLLLLLAWVLCAQPTFDNAADMGSSSSATFTTGNFTVGSGSNRVLTLYTHTNNNSGAYQTGVTFDGVPMSPAATPQHCNPANAITATAWILAAPHSGAHPFVISSAGGATTDALAISYSGADQSGVPDSTSVNCFGQVGGDVLYTVNITTVAANCMMVMGVSVGPYDTGMGATGVVRAQQPSMVYLADLVATSSGANSISLETKFNGGVETAMITLAIAPAGGSPATAPRHKSTIL